MCLVESAAVKVLEWIENFTPRFPEHVIYKKHSKANSAYHFIIA